MHKGFTLVETLLVAAIVSILLILSAPFYNTFQISNQLDTFSSEVLQALRKSQMKAITLENDENDSTWGVYFEKNIGDKDKFVLFKGPDYLNRDPIYDEITELPNTISFDEISLNEGGTEVLFEKINGSTNHYGFLEIKSTANEEKTITINEAGRISIQ